MQTTAKSSRTRRASGKQRCRAAAASTAHRARAIRILAREQRNYDDPLPSREMILADAQGAGRSGQRRAAGATAAHRRPTSWKAFERRLGAMQRDGQIMRNRRDAICVVDQARSDHRHGAGPSRRLRLSGARRRGARTCSCGPTKCTRCCTATAWSRASRGIDRRGRPRGQDRRSARARQPAAWSAACTTSTACCSWSPRTSASARTSWCRRATRWTPSPARS